MGDILKPSGCGIEQLVESDGKPLEEALLAVEVKTLTEVPLSGGQDNALHFLFDRQFKRAVDPLAGPPEVFALATPYRRCRHSQGLAPHADVQGARRREFGRKGNLHFLLVEVPDQTSSVHAGDGETLVLLGNLRGHLAPQLLGRRIHVDQRVVLVRDRHRHRRPIQRDLDARHFFTATLGLRDLKSHLRLQRLQPLHQPAHFVVAGDIDLMRVVAADDATEGRRHLVQRQTNGTHEKVGSRDDQQNGDNDQGDRRHPRLPVAILCTRVVAFGVILQELE